MKYRFPVYILFPALILASCVIDLSKPKPDPDPDPPAPKEKAYKAKVRWKTEIFGSLSTTLIEGQYGYFSVSGVSGGGSRILKINLENGKAAWESSLIRQHFYYEPHKIGGYVYFLTNSGLIFVFNDTSGNLAATVMPGETETEAADYAIHNNGVTAAWDHYLFWGNKEGGLSRLDCRNIDFSKNPDKTQVITPDMVWNEDWQPKITTNMLSKDGKIYFLTEIDLPDNPEYVSILRALDAETGVVMWESEPLSRGGYFSSLVLNGEKLHIIGKNNFCCDRNTGDMIYKNSDLTNTPWPSGASYITNIKLYNNVFYYVSRSSDRGQEIVGINADTGKREFLITDIWDTTPPQVYGEKLYILHETGLRVYSVSGTASGNDGFIGVDKSFEGRIYSPYIGIYNDTLILFRDYSDSFITAIQCE